MVKYLCTHCNETWEGKEGMKLCPFCGEKLETEKKKINREDIKNLEDALIFIIDNYGVETFSIPDKVNSYLSEFISNESKEVRLYKVADEIGAVEVIIESINKNEEEQLEAVKEAKYKLENDAFISEENAKFIVDILVKGFGIKVKEENVDNKQINEDDKFSQIENAKVGDIIRFGKYEWLVLNKTGDTALVITKDIIAHKAYNEEWVDITWEKCTLRSWLNGEFYNSFTDTEKAMIADTYVKNDDNLEYGTEGGKDTTDKVFLLSIEEADKYFKDDETRIAYTIDPEWKEYCDKNYNSDYSFYWWLRSPGDNANSAANVDYGGSVDDYGGGVDHNFYGVRPALNLKY